MISIAIIYIYTSAVVSRGHQNFLEITDNAPNLYICSSLNPVIEGVGAELMKNLQALFPVLEVLVPPFREVN